MYFSQMIMFISLPSFRHPVSSSFLPVPAVERSWPWKGRRFQYPGPGDDDGVLGFPDQVSP